VYRLGRVHRLPHAFYNDPQDVCWKVSHGWHEALLVVTAKNRLIRIGLRPSSRVGKEGVLGQEGVLCQEGVSGQEGVPGRQKQKEEMLIQLEIRS
jgi:hypothetical protein